MGSSFSKLKTTIPTNFSKAISLVVTAAFGAELSYILIKIPVTHEVVIKLSLLGASIAFTWIIFAAAMHAKFGKKIGSRRNSYMSIGIPFFISLLIQQRKHIRSSCSLLTRKSSQFIQNLQRRRSHSKEKRSHSAFERIMGKVKQTHRSLLIFRSSLFKPSSSEERYRKTYSINSFGNQPAPLPEYVPSDSSPDNVKTQLSSFFLTW